MYCPTVGSGKDVHLESVQGRKGSAGGAGIDGMLGRKAKTSKTCPGSAQVNRQCANVWA